MIKQKPCFRLTTAEIKEIVRLADGDRSKGMFLIEGTLMMRRRSPLEDYIRAKQEEERRAQRTGVKEKHHGAE